MYDSDCGVYDSFNEEDVCVEDGVGNCKSTVLLVLGVDCSILRKFSLNCDSSA